ncbi:hypothetical protein QFZ71_000396 [Streptomyces sp. V2I9]|nr:hypothetical protein [Streptomyces sp. V2I9]
MLDAGPDLLVGLVVLLLPVREFALAALSAVRDDESGARVAAVGDCEGLADGGFGTGFLPCLAVVAVPGERSADDGTRRVSASMTTGWLVEYR